MALVKLNKQKSAIKSNDKKKRIFIAASSKFGQIRPLHSSTTLADSFFCKVNKNSA